MFLIQVKDYCIFAIMQKYNNVIMQLCITLPEKQCCFFSIQNFLSHSKFSCTTKLKTQE